MDWKEFHSDENSARRDWRLYKCLSEEVKTGHDDAARIQEILEHHRFETHFGEDEKLQVLIGSWQPLLRPFMGRLFNEYFTHEPIIDSVLKGDNSRILRALLPVIPTCRVAYWVTARNPPPEIARLREIKKTLRAAQSRWWPEFVAHRCKNNHHTSSDLEKSYPLVKYASDVLGAELFERCMECPASQFPTRCALYLLAVCPQLLAIRGFYYTVAPKLLEIPSLGEVFLDRSIMQYLGHSIGEIISNLIRTPKHSKSHMDYMKVFLSIAGRLFSEKILNYRKAFPIEHWPSAHEERLFCIAQLLELGFDPETTDMRDMNAVEVLTSEFFEIIWTNYNSSAESVENLHLVSGMFLLNVSAMLPYFSVHSPISCMTLPRLAPCHSIEDFKQGLVKIWQVFIDVDVFPRCSVKNITQILMFGITDFMNMEEPLALLVHRELSKGLDATSQRCELASLGAIRESSLLEWLMRNLQKSHEWWRECEWQNTNARTDVPDRYWWQTLELIVHCNRSLRGLSVDRLFKVLGREGNNGEFVPQSLSAVRRVIRMLWLYAPRTKPRIEAFLQKLALSRDPDAQKTATDLQNMMSRFPSLQALARRCIVRRVRFQDIARLPLPTLLKHYLQVGEISPDHPIVTGLGLEKL